MKLLERILAYLLNRESIALSNKLDDKVNEVWKVNENIERAEMDIINWKEDLKTLDKESRRSVLVMVFGKPKCLFCGKELPDGKVGFCNSIHRFKYEARMKLYGL